MRFLPRHSAKRLGRCLRQNHAVAALEFALVLPLVLTLFYGLIEVSRLVLVQQKLVKASFSIGDLLTQGTTVCDADLDNMSIVTQEILKPYTARGSFAFTVTSAASRVGVTRPDPPCADNGSDCITWQRSIGGAPSYMGRPGQIPNLPADTISPGQNLLIVETFYTYMPMLAISAQIVPMLASRNIYNMTVFKPRAGDLVTFGGCD